jgi:hypothetical protein
LTNPPCFLDMIKFKMGFSVLAITLEIILYTVYNRAIAPNVSAEKCPIYFRIREMKVALKVLIIVLDFMDSSTAFRISFPTVSQY